MTIEVSFKRAINNAFVHTIFKDINEKTILNTLNTKVYGSADVSLLPPIPKVEVENNDDNSTFLKICFDDYVINGIVSWQCTASGYVFLHYE